MGFLTGIKGKSPSTYETRPAPAQPNPAALLQPIWFVDPSNVTGNASDSNTGLTVATPLLTFGEIVDRWGTSSPTITNDVTIKFLSDQLGFDDPVNVSPFFDPGTSGTTAALTSFAAGLVTVTGLAGVTAANGASFVGQYLEMGNTTDSPNTGSFLVTAFAGPGSLIIANPAAIVPDPNNGSIEWSIGGHLFIQGTLTPVLSDTISVFTPINRPDGTDNMITGTTIPLMDFTPYVNFLVQDTAVNAWFWIDPQTVAPGPATITAPLAGAAGGQPALGPNYTGLTPPPPPFALIGLDAFTIWRPTQVYCTNLGAIDNPLVNNPNTSSQGIYLQNIWATEQPDLETRFMCGKVFLQQCRVDSSYGAISLLEQSSATNCALTGQVFATSLLVYAGTVSGTFHAGPTVQGIGIVIDGDTILDGFLACITGQCKLGTVHVTDGVGVFGGATLSVNGPNTGFIYYWDPTTTPPGGTAIWGDGFFFSENGGKFIVYNDTSPTLITATSAIQLSGGFYVDSLTGPGSALSTFTPGAPGSYSNAVPVPVRTDVLATMVSILDTPGPGAGYCIMNPQTLTCLVMAGDTNDPV